MSLKANPYRGVGDLVFYCNNYHYQDTDNNKFHKTNPNKILDIYCVGRLANPENYGEKCLVIVNGLKPTLYMRIPGKIVFQLEHFFNKLMTYLPHYKQNDFVNPYNSYDSYGNKIEMDTFTIVKNYVTTGHLLDGFRPINEYFVKLEFYSEDTKKEMAKKLLRAQKFDFTTYISDFLTESKESFEFYHGQDYKEYQETEKTIPTTLFTLPIILCDYKLDSILQFFHERNILPSNFQRVQKFRLLNAQAFNVDHVFSCHYTNFEMIDPKETKSWTVPMNCLSFDCEMNSHHGDFPRAIKDYSKFCKELVSKFFLFYKTYCITDASQLSLLPSVSTCTKHAFDLEHHEILKKEINKIYTYNNEKPSQNNIEFFSKFAEEQILAVLKQIQQWDYEATIKKRKKDDVKKLTKQLRKNLVKRLLQLTQFEDPNIDKKNFTNNTTQLLFPKVIGDEIIQIGMVFNWFRGEECYRKILLSLKGCDESLLPGTEVYCFDNDERKLLLAFKEFIVDEKPDVIFGYNIKTFDWDFLYNRAIELQIHNEYSSFGLFRNNPCNLRKLKLQSAGLGDNYLSFPNLPGTTQLDMLGIARHSAKSEVTNFDLSTVSSNYIFGKILFAQEVHGKIILVTDTIYALHEKDFILINYFEMKKTSILNGKKFLIEKIFYLNTNSNLEQLEQMKQEQLEQLLKTMIPEHLQTKPILIIDLCDKLLHEKSKETCSISEQNENKLLLEQHQNFKDMEWGLAKDDVTVNNIFEYFKRDDYSRGIIAKYCIKDCLLVTNLVAKLEVLMNNIAMSNVSIVPLQDLFIRGQGRKFFSLTSKECRMDNYFIPHSPKGNFQNQDDDADSILSALEYELLQDGFHYDDENGENGENGDNGDNDDNSYNGENDDNSNNGTDNEFDDEKKEEYTTNSLKSLSKRVEITSTVTANLKKKKELEETEAEGYEGAIVLTPCPDLYTDPIVTLDFGSLYPSSMIDRNLSHDSFVKDQRYLGEDGKQRLRTEFQLECEDIYYDNYIFVRKGKSKKRFLNKENPVVICRFIQPRKDEMGKIIDSTRGKIPQILIKILAERKLAKKQKAKETSEFRIQLMESTQLAYKLTANSGYGTIGATVSELHCKEVAACTTAIGRSMLEFAQQYVLSNYQNTKIVYGDSVTSDTPILLRINGKLHLTTIGTYECNNPNWYQYHNDKLALNVKEANISIWTEMGWTIITRFIKHFTNKKIYRVFTTTGCVHVTEDHSLLNDSNEKITIKECQMNQTKLMTSMILYDINKKSNESDYKIHYNYDELFLFGVYMKYGRIQFNHIFLDFSVDETFSSLSRIDKFYFMSKIKNTSIQNVQYNNYCIKIYDDIFIKTCKKVFYTSDTKCKTIPMNIVLSKNQTIVKSFYEGMIWKNKVMMFNSHDFITLQSIYLFFHFHHFLRRKAIVYNKNELPTLEVIESNQNDINQESNQDNTIKYISEITTNSEKIEVYDLETENHHFHAGIGNLIVHNTDSVFVKFDFTTLETKEQKLERAFQLGFDVEHNIQPLLRHPHVLEFEKVYFPYYLFSKKKYAGYKYESDVYNKFNHDMSIIIHKFKKDFNGIAPKRRDSCLLAKTIYLDILWTLFNTNNIHIAYNLLQEKLTQLVNGKYPLETLIVTKTLKSFYENPDQIGHKVLADRLEEQGFIKYMPNDRIPFIYVDIGTQEKNMISDTMEHPDLVKLKGLKPDYVYYIEKQLGNNIAQLFYLIVDRLPEYRLPIDYFHKRQLTLIEKYPDDEKKVLDTIKKEKLLVTQNILFDKILTPIRQQRLKAQRTDHNERNHQKEITGYFQKQNNNVISINKRINNQIIEPSSHLQYSGRSKSTLAINGIKDVRKKLSTGSNNTMNMKNFLEKNSTLFK